MNNQDGGITSTSTTTTTTTTTTSTPFNNLYSKPQRKQSIRERYTFKFATEQNVLNKSVENEVSDDDDEKSSDKKDSDNEIEIIENIQNMLKDENDFSKYQQRYELQNQNTMIEMSSSVQSDLSTSGRSSIECSGSGSQRPLMVDIGLEYKYRIAIEQNPKDLNALVKWGNLIYKNIKNQLGGKLVDVCLLNWNEELIPIPQSQNTNNNNHNNNNNNNNNNNVNHHHYHNSQNILSDSLNAFNLKEPLFDACGKYQNSLQLSNGSNLLLNIPFSTLLNYNINDQYNNLISALNNNNNTNNNNSTTTPDKLSPTDDPNSPWSDPILWMKWGDCLFLLCTFLDLPMYRATCEKYFKCVQMLFKTISNGGNSNGNGGNGKNNNNNNNSNKKSIANINLLAIVLRKWGIALSRYSRRMKSQFLMSEWTSEENIQVEDLWKVLHSQSIQALLTSNKISTSLITQYHIATAYHRHAITLNQFGGTKEAVYGLITNSCKIYYETLLDSLSDYPTITTDQRITNGNGNNGNNNSNLNGADTLNSPNYFNQNEIFNDQYKSKSLENWGRALDVQLSTKLSDEEETIEKEEEDLNSVDEYLTTFSKAIHRGIHPSLEGVVSLCLNSTQALQYKAINSISVLCRSKDITSFPIYNELTDQMLKVESFVSKRDDAESLLSQQKTLKSMPPKLQAYVRMSGLGEEEIMKNFEIAWNSIYFLTKDTIQNQPIPPNYYRSNKKNKLKTKQQTNNNNQDDEEEDTIKPPLLPSIHRTTNINGTTSLDSSINGVIGGNIIITPFTSNSQSKYNTKRNINLSNSSYFNIGGGGSNGSSSGSGGSSLTTSGSLFNSGGSSSNYNISPTKSNWTITLPSKTPTRRATVSLVNLNNEIIQCNNGTINQSINNNNNNNNNNNLSTQQIVENKPISKFISSNVIRTTVNPLPLSRCDESIFSSGSPLQLFKDKIKLGTGAFGNVFYAVKKSDSKPVAIKVLMERTKKESPIIPELYIHSACSHPNIVTYMESYLCKGHLWIILEYCDGGTVRDLLQNDWKNNGSGINNGQQSVQPLEETLIAYITEELLEGLVYLRSKGIIHRDLKSRNILLTRKGKVKIADFGLATTCSLGRGRTRMCGTLGRIAPEVIRREPYDTQADIYSLGCLMVEMAEGNIPYGKDSSLKSLFYTAIYPYKLQNPRSFTKEFVDFLYLCLDPDPFTRPTPEMLLNHSFLSGADRGKSILLNRFKNQDSRKNLLLDNFVAF